MQDRQEGPVPAVLAALAAVCDRLTAQGPHAGVLLPGLAPHEQRVVQEAVDLGDKLAKLGAFTAGPVFDGLSNLDQVLLLRQESAMAEYAFVLASRIQRFKGGQ